MENNLIHRLIFYVNGRQIVEYDPVPAESLLHYLRTKCLTGSKLGCGEGGCGACTVMISRYSPRTKDIRHFSVNACLVPLCSVHGMAVTTVEGIGSIRNGLHPVQERLAKSHGTQCGFCTPGIVMSMYTLIRNKPQPSMEEIQKALEGNLCRCTGYRPILEGFKSFAIADKCCGLKGSCCSIKDKPVNAQIKTSESFVDYVAIDSTQDPIFPPLLQKCCGLKGSCCSIKDKPVNAQIKTSESSVDYIPINSTQDPIFPPSLQTDTYEEEYLVFKGEGITWIRPTSLSELLLSKTQYPNAKVVTGNTEVGIEMKNVTYSVLIAPTHVKELKQLTQKEDGLYVGAATTLAELEQSIRKVLESIPEHRTRVLQALLEMLRWFAGRQIRNVASIGGNIITASPVSDLNPILMAAGVELYVQSLSRGKRTVKLDKNFFIGYRKTVIKSDEILVSLKLPYTSKNEYIFGYKQAHRREDDIAIVNAGISVLFEDNTDIVKDIKMAFGGMAPITVMPVNTMKKVIGSSRWNDDLLNTVSRMLVEELTLTPGAPGGMVNYRQALTISFFFKFFLTVRMQLTKKVSCIDDVPLAYESATSVYHKKELKFCQLFEEKTPGQLKDSVGRPIPHIWAEKQVTGEAIYVDDMPHYTDELYLAFVYSNRAHARIVSVQFVEALTAPGVVDYIDANCLRGPNTWGPNYPDEVIFATDKVTCVGQIIGAVVADTKDHAKLAARKVEVTYEELPHIITIKDAISKESYYCHLKIESGNVDQGFEMSDHIIEGEVHVGGQEHFYLETQVSLAVPKNEDGAMEIFISTQGPTETQAVVASALGIQRNKVVVRVKRLGGGFGGKERRCNLSSVPVAIAADRLQRPVRCMLDRDEDMVTTGTRHPFMGKFKVGFTKNGKILALDLDLYSNAGNTIDESAHVMEKAMFHCSNSYRIPNVHVRGHVCKTNIASNTSFRGFGAPQTMFICETFITDIASHLNMSPTKVRDVNLFEEGSRTHYNQSLDGCNLRRCWTECLHSSNFTEQQKKVEMFNRENRWKKRGIAIIPTTYGVGFEKGFLNQAGALAMIYRDGSVLLTHGGTEMGQGLHTKMIQVASRELGVPVSKIHIEETCTNTVPNTSFTAASVSSDLNGMAVINACTALRERLEPYIKASPNGTWEEWVNSAYFDRVSLSSTGFYKTPDVGYDIETNTGIPFNYYSFGVGCSEVEIDCLTGDHQILRTDIVMDVGQSLNPAIDVGQIEGAFVQGYGLMMMEQQKMSPDGHLRTKGSGTYKIPSFGDIPAEFNVSLLKGSHNKRAVYSSKAIGEPPLFLSASVFFAVKDAISSARKDAGFQANFRLNSPATPEMIRMACLDLFTKQLPPLPDSDSFTPWFTTL